MHVPAAQFFGAYLFSGCRLDQRRATKKDSPLAFDDDVLIGHRRHIRPAGCARAQDDRHLRDAKRGHARLIVKNAAEVVAVRENVGLVGQIGSAGVHQIDTGQVVVLRDFLGTQVLLHG